MQPPLTRQEVQTIVDNARNRIFERMVTRRDIQLVGEGARDRVLGVMQSMHQQDQQLIRHAIAHVDAQTQTSAMLQARLAALEQELRQLRMALTQVTAQLQHQALPGRVLETNTAINQTQPVHYVEQTT